MHRLFTGTTSCLFFALLCPPQIAGAGEESKTGLLIFPPRSLFAKGAFDPSPPCLLQIETAGGLGRRRAEDQNGITHVNAASFRLRRILMWPL